MILKAFKEKSNQKYINNLLNTQCTRVSKAKVNTVGLVFNLEEFTDLALVKSLCKTLNFEEKSVTVIGLSAQENSSGEQEKVKHFCAQDFGWKGRVKHLELKAFVDSPFDMLISFYKADTLELNMVTALSKANFKVGLSTKDKRLNDLTIDVEPKAFTLFTEELKKYLTILNKM